MAHSLLSLVEDKKNKERRRRARKGMWRSEREKGGIRFHPGSMLFY